MPRRKKVRGSALYATDGRLRGKICASDCQWGISEHCGIRWSTCLPRLPHGGAVRKICRDTEMQSETCLHQGRPFGAGPELLRPGSGTCSLPDGLHHEADDHRQSHAAAHGSDDDGRDFACGGGTAGAATKWMTEEDGRVRPAGEVGSRVGRILDAHWPEERSFHDSAKKSERKKWLRL